MAVMLGYETIAGSGYCALKAYHSIQGVGTRYVVSLYRLKDGELLAVLDAQRITDLRTGAASGVIARRVALSAPVSVGVIGSGHQACTQLESLAAVYRVKSAAVYSPTRAQFAEVDVQCFRDAALTVVDTPHAFEEAGELRQAIADGALPETRRATLSQIVTGAVSMPREGRVVFKSVGSALQDLALASRYYELLGAREGLSCASDVGSLKRPVSASGA